MPTRSRLAARSIGRTAILAITLAFAGCGDNTPPDEAPPPGGPVTFLHQNAPVTEYAFPATIPQGHASALFVLRNDTAAALPAITAAVEGDPGFVIDEALSTCSAGPALVPHDLCTVFVRWAADATTATAELVVTSSDVTSRLTIRGPVGVSGSVIAGTSAIDFGVVPIGSTASAQVRLANQTATDVEIRPTLPGGFSLGQTDCPYLTAFYPSVPANGSCTVRVVFTATTAGWIEVVGAFAGAPVTLAAYGARRVFVDKRGTGTGEITSVPSGIQCGTDCRSHSAYVIGDATLYARPDDGSRFAGWKLECGTDPTCVVPEQAEGSIGVTFAGPGSAAVRLTISGAAAGKLFIGDSPPPTGAFDQLTECARSCTTYVPVGARLEIYAATPSRFAGWAGGCGGGDAHCVLPTITGDVATTATFDKEDRELVTLLPEVPPARAVAFAPDGDLVIASLNAVTKLGPDGTIRWSRKEPTPGRITDLAVTTAGDIYTQSIDELTGNAFLNRRAMTGAVLGTTGGRPPSCLIGAVTVHLAGRLMAAPNGDLGIFTGGVVGGQATNLLVALKPDGAPRFSVDLGRGCATAVAVGPSGGYQALIGEQPGGVATSFRVARYDAAGGALPGSGPYAMTGAAPSVAVDSAGALAFHLLGPDTDFPGSHTVGRVRLDGTIAFTATSPGGAGGWRDVAYDLAGDVIAAHTQPGLEGPGWLRLDQRSPTGSALWSLDKSPYGTSQLPPALEVTDLALGASGQVAVVGRYSPVTDRPGAWIAIYQVP